MPAKIKTPLKSSSRSHPQRPRGIGHKAFHQVYWPYLPVILVIGVLSGLGFKSGVLPSALRHPTGQVLAYASEMSVSQLLSDTNAQRTQNNEVGLQLNQSLAAAAQAKANDMAARNYWSHDTPDGNPPWVFVTNQNYTYQKLGENLAAGFNNAMTTISGWMASPHHRENLLDPAFSEVGFGFANNPKYTAGNAPMTIVVAFYGKPSPLAAASQNSSPTITLQKDRSQAFTTLTATKGAAVSVASSRANVAFAGLPVAGAATSLVIFMTVAALGIWMGRHVLAVRRFLIKGETYVISHPFMDVGLLVISALSFLLSRTAGFTS